MSEAADMPRTGPHRPSQGRRRAHRPVSLEGPPTPEEVAQQTPEQQERFPLYTPEQIGMETRTVRFDTSFDDVLQIRDQFEMIAEACRIIIAITRKRDIGSIQQRVDARREAAGLSKTLALFRGKYPRGVWKPKPRKP